VLILDNIDDASFLLAAKNTRKKDQTNAVEADGSQPLLAYLPQSQSGSILITSRTKGAALKLVEESDMIAVEPMEESHAAALFKKKLGHSDTEGIADLVRALEFMPLAIVQAAAYIAERAPRCSVYQYLEEFRRSDSEKATLLDKEAGHLRRDWEAKNSIIITWQISFHHIRQIRPSAADLLSLMSFFDRQGIPEVVLRDRVESTKSKPTQHKRRARVIWHLKRVFDRNRNSSEPKEEDQASGQTDNFEEDLRILRNYSFISVAEDRTTFEMHALVQVAMRKWLEANGKLERWKKQYIKNLSFEFPMGEYENWARCQLLFPHAKLALAQKPENEESLKEWSTLLYNAAWYAWRTGNVLDAERMAVEAMEVDKKVLGPQHKDTIRSMVMVGLAYGLRGRWDEAEKLFMEAMELGKKVLGAEHADTLTSMSELAAIYGYQGRWDEGEKLLLLVVETEKRTLGPEHPSTLHAVSNLAATFWKQGRLDQAAELFTEVIDTRTRVLGPDHPDTLISMSNLAFSRWKRGQSEEAEASFRQVMETRKRVLGAEHPATLTTMHNLAYAWKDKGQNEEARKLMEECAQARTRVLGADHPYTIDSMTALEQWQAELATGTTKRVSFETVAT
jgi:tetratricopeptide (TPR) repeat protein